MKYWLYRTQFNLAPKLDWVTKFPTHIDLELTNKCNLACVMCPHGMESWNPKKGQMSLKMAKNLLEQGSGKAKSVKFNFRGEPLLNKNFETLVEYAKDLGYVETLINTNGMALTKRRAEKIADSGLDKLIISVDGATKESYEKIRVGGNWNKLLKNINYFREINKNTKIKIQMIYQQANEGEIQKFYDLFSFAELSVRSVMNRGKDFTCGEEIAVGRKRCGHPWQRLAIGWDGKVYGCCNAWNEEALVGNVKEMTLKEIWHGINMTRLRDINKAGTQDSHFPCNDCSVGTSYKWR